MSFGVWRDEGISRWPRRYLSIFVGGRERDFIGWDSPVCDWVGDLLVVLISMLFGGSICLT